MSLVLPIAILGSALIALAAWHVVKYRKRYETEKAQLQAQLFQADKLAALGELIGGVAHEINNPIGVMLSRIELMIQESREGCEPAGHVKDLEVLRKHTSRIGTIAQNLLSFARKSGAEHVRLDLNEVVRQTLPLIEHEFKKKNIALEINLSGDLPPVKGNFNQLQQVLLNILTNARDALTDISAGNPAGGPPPKAEGGPLAAGDGADPVCGPKIQIGTWRVPGDGKVRLGVADNGPSITQEHLGRIFDPFFTTKKGGTGLGLSVSYGIIREHDGMLNVASDGRRRGCGTCFTVTLPISK
ncbi:MAG: hypothetical protein HY747_08690 [Elusimicrobia bacterium]|nr:hypothetical protein [Elusimicrobiota bacterium]